MRGLALAMVVILVSLSVACRETVHEAEHVDEQGHVVARRTPDSEKYAGDALYLRKNADFFFRVWDEGFTRRLDDLPESGEVAPERMPYSGAYYPNSGGGIDVVVAGNRSPLAKYDQAFHSGARKAVQWERDNHVQGPSWSGHCNGLAAAAQRHPKEPMNAVTRNGVTFDPRDIKALLAEVHMSADFEFLGGQRCEDTSPDYRSGRESRPNPEVMAPCEDINPGTFHAALANWVGRMRHPIINDYSRKDEVWNYTLFKYQTNSIKKGLSADQASQYLGGRGTYLYNREATSFAYIDLNLHYGAAGTRETLGRFDAHVQRLGYILELNAQGEIIGGEWVGRSVEEHPDFLWVALPPMTPNGTRYMSNPFVETKQVIELWAESVGFDPQNPPSDITRPDAGDTWGKWANFEVTLDGNNHGAVFAGKPASMLIKRKDALLTGTLDLEILLNGAPLKTIAFGEDKESKQDFEPGLGLSRLQFLWKRDGAVVEDQYLRFHVAL